MTSKGFKYCLSSVSHWKQVSISILLGRNFSGGRPFLLYVYGTAIDETCCFCPFFYFSEFGIIKSRL